MSPSKACGPTVERLGRENGAIDRVLDAMRRVDRSRGRQARDDPQRGVERIRIARPEVAGRAGGVQPRLQRRWPLRTPGSSAATPQMVGFGFRALGAR